MKIFSSLLISMTCLIPDIFCQIILPDTFSITEEIHGITIHDPFRGLEHTDDPLVKSWMKEENERTVRALQQIPAFSEIAKEVHTYHNSIEYRSGVPLYFNNCAFVIRTESATNFDMITIFAHPQDSGQTIFSTEQIDSEEMVYKIDQLSPSPDGKIMAMSVYDIYTGMSEIRLLDLATYELLPDIIDASVSFFPNWLFDSQSFFYTQADENGDAESIFNSIRVKHHSLGQDQENDKIIIDQNELRDIKYGAFEFPSLYPLPDKKHIVLMIASGVSPHPSAYVAKLDDVLQLGGKAHWKQVVSYEDEVRQLSWDKNYFYFLVSHENAQRGDAQRGDAQHATARRPGSVVGNAQPGAAQHGNALEQASASKEVLQRIHIQGIREREMLYEPEKGFIQEYVLAKNDIYIHYIHNGLGFIDQLSNGSTKAIQLPFAGTVELGSIASYDESKQSELFIGLSGWNRGYSIYHFNSNAQQFELTRMRPSGEYEKPEDLVVEEVEVTSHDGEKVPLSIIYHKNLKKEGNHPTIIEVYGAYGESLDPYLSIELLSWYKRGGIMAYAHVRGGGEKGTPWHKAAVKENKPNSWKDLIACAKYLISEGYTQTDILGVRGGSAGGIAAGRAIIQEPALFKAALLEYPLVNTSRLDQVSIGEGQSDEFGSIESPEEYRHLLEMDTYLKVKKDTIYPEIMLTTGTTDHLVPVWQASKLAARFLDVNGNKEKTFFRLYQGGHFTGGAEEELTMKVEALSFFIWKLTSVRQ